MKRRGRRRKTAARHPSGKIICRSHEEREADVVSVVVEARIRVHSVFKGNARQKEAGYALGRAWIRGELSAEQVEAGERFEEIHRNYNRALMAKSVASAGNLDRQGGYDGSSGTEPGYVERCAAEQRAYTESRRVLLDTSPLALFAVETWVIEDKEAWSLIGDLRLGLNALVKLYRIERRELPRMATC